VEPDERDKLRNDLRAYARALSKMPHPAREAELADFGASVLTHGHTVGMDDIEAEDMASKVDAFLREMITSHRDE
jgi:hypothetical protein